MFRNILLIGLLLTGAFFWLSPTLTYLDLVNPLGHPIPRYNMEIALALTYAFTLGTLLLVCWLLLWMNQYESPAEIMIMALIACFGWDLGTRYPVFTTLYYGEPAPYSLSIVLFHLIFTTLFGAYLYIHEEWNRLNFEAKLSCYLQAGASLLLLISFFSKPVVALIYCFTAMVSLWFGIQAIFVSTRKSLKMNLISVLIPLPGFCILCYLLIAPHISDWAGARILGYRPEGFFTKLIILGKPLSESEKKIVQANAHYQEILKSDHLSYQHAAKGLIAFFLLGIALKTRKKGTPQAFRPPLFERLALSSFKFSLFSKKDSRMKMIRIANGQGFWGDSILGPVRLVREGPIDYLTLDYLAEVTMSIMQKLKQRNPEAGYATDFVEMIERLLPELQEKKIKVVANAGGINPNACRKAVAKVVKKLREQNKLKPTPIRIGVVTGDDILPTLDQMIQAGEAFKNMDTGEPLSTIRNRVLSANVYIGIEPIVEALKQGADIVIVGRCTDPSLVLGPMVYEFGWDMNDLDKLAAGTIAGHIAECGPQCTGGNFTDWRQIPNFANIGYPVVEAYPDGHFVLTKHDQTGGLVNKATVTSQLVYEMGDPKRYLTPDVIADFTSIQMEEIGPDRLKISGIRGTPKPETLKVSISYLNGYKTSGQLTISGPDALEKAKLCTQIIFDRLKMDHCEFKSDQITVEYLGTAVCHAGIATMPTDLPEVVLRIGVKDEDEDKVDRFGKEIAPIITSGPPGVTGFSGGRPKATEIVGYWPALVSRNHIQIRVTTEEA